jgi:hypothetical protein
MCSPSLQHLLVQAHVQELHRSRRALSTKPIATTGRIVNRRRSAAKLASYLASAIERFVGHPGPEAPAI